MHALIVSGVHSNLEALQSVTDDAQRRKGFDQIWSLGDLVGYGPYLDKCMDVLRRHDSIGVSGNHDLATIGKLSVEASNSYASMAIVWTTEQLTGELHHLRLRSLRRPRIRPLRG